MFSKKLAALVATSLLVATSPVMAQSPVNVIPASASVIDASELSDGGNGSGLWVALIGAALLAAFILVVIDDEDEFADRRVSP